MGNRGSSRTKTKKDRAQVADARLPGGVAGDRTAADLAPPPRGPAAIVIDDDDTTETEATDKPRAATATAQVERDSTDLKSAQPPSQPVEVPEPSAFLAEAGLDAEPNEDELVNQLVQHAQRLVGFYQSPDDTGSHDLTVVSPDLGLSVEIKHVAAVEHGHTPYQLYEAWGKGVQRLDPDQGPGARLAEAGREWREATRAEPGAEVPLATVVDEDNRLAVQVIDLGAEEEALQKAEQLFQEAVEALPAEEHDGFLTQWRQAKDDDRLALADYLLHNIRKAGWDARKVRGLQDALVRISPETSYPWSRVKALLEYVTSLSTVRDRPSRRAPQRTETSPDDEPAT